MVLPWVAENYVQADNGNAFVLFERRILDGRAGDRQAGLMRCHPSVDIVT